MWLKLLIILLSLAGTARWALSLTQGGVKIDFAKIAAGVVGMFALLIALSSFGVVGAGERGVVTRFGATTGKVLGPGLYAVTPFVDGVQMMNVQVQVDRTDAQAASKDLQAVATSVALNYALDPPYTSWLYKNIGTDFKNRIIDPAVQEAVKAVTARYNAENLVSERDLVKAELIREITSRLSQSHILVTAVSLTNFAFSADFTKAVEDKVVATQQALKAQNDLATKKFEAEQIVVTAQANAEAIRVSAAAIQSQGGAAYVQLQAITKWDGVLPVNMYGSAPVPFININSKEK